MLHLDLSEKRTKRIFFARWMGWGKVVSPILKFAAGKTLVWSRAGGWKVLIKEVTSSKIWFSSLGWSSGVRCVLQVNKIECENLSSEENNGRGKDNADEYCSPRWSARAERSRWGSCPSPSWPTPTPSCWCCRPRPRQTRWRPGLENLFSFPTIWFLWRLLAIWWLSLIPIQISEKCSIFMCWGKSQTLGLAEEITRKIEDYIAKTWSWRNDYVKNLISYLFQFSNLFLTKPLFTHG